MQLPRGGGDVESIFMDRYEVAQLLKFHRRIRPGRLKLSFAVGARLSYSIRFKTHHE
jgi:hypothetical protein